MNKSHGKAFQKIADAVKAGKLLLKVDPSVEDQVYLVDNEGVVWGILDVDLINMAIETKSS